MSEQELRNLYPLHVCEAGKEPRLATEEEVRDHEASKGFRLRKVPAKEVLLEAVSYCVGGVTVMMPNEPEADTPMEVRAG
jgi:hypothetical protein